MAWRPHGRAFTNPNNPRSYAICDRCGLQYNHDRLAFQFDFRGPQLQNLRILVCERCTDRPSPGYRPIIVPPDPLPIQNPRPEWFAADENNYFTTMGADFLVTEDDDRLVIEGGGEDVL